MDEEFDQFAGRPDHRCSAILEHSDWEELLSHIMFNTNLCSDFPAIVSVVNDMASQLRINLSELKAPEDS